jgi:hypothetical protein
MLTNARGLIAVAALALGAVACSGSDSGTTGQLVVRLTDSPTDNLQSATVWISSVYLMGGTDTLGNRYVITSTPQAYDLLTLANGVTTQLGAGTIPVGEYTHMRLVVDSARVTLKSGLTFTDGTSSKLLHVPSGQQTGIKVNFVGRLDVVPGQTILVVDFDVARNFIFMGTAAHPTGVIFRPVLYATVQDIAASIAGTVSPAAAKARLFAIFGADTVASALADSLTGAYTLRFLYPQTYTIAAAAEGYQPATASVTVRAAQDTTGVNFTLAP